MDSVVPDVRDFNNKRIRIGNALKERKHSAVHGWF